MLKKKTGFPARYWIAQETVQEAKRLLACTTLDTREIAHAVGYPEHPYFCRVFKKHAGLSPLAFRRKCGE